METDAAFEAAVAKLESSRRPKAERLEELRVLDPTSRILDLRICDPAMGSGRDDAAYVLDQFPIDRREDEERHGRFLTRDLVLAYMNAVAAGDLETRVSL